MTQECARASAFSNEDHKYVFSGNYELYFETTFSLQKLLQCLARRNQSHQTTAIVSEAGIQVHHSKGNNT